VGQKRYPDIAQDDFASILRLLFGVKNPTREKGDHELFVGLWLGYRANNRNVRRHPRRVLRDAKIDGAGQTARTSKTDCRENRRDARDAHTAQKATTSARRRVELRSGSGSTGLAGRAPETVSIARSWREKSGGACGRQPLARPAVTLRRCHSS